MNGALDEAVDLLRRVERYLHATYDGENAELLRDIRIYLTETTGHIIEPKVKEQEPARCSQCSHMMVFHHNGACLLSHCSCGVSGE